MKKLKLLNIFILAISCFLIINIQAKAESYVYCYYNYTPGDKDKDFKIFPGGFCLANCDKPASMLLQIYYHETKQPEPRFAGRVILASDANYSDGYQKEFSSDIKYQAITSNNTTSLSFVDLPAVNINQIQSDDGKLMCPNVYLFKESYTTGKPRYQVGLSPDARSDTGDIYDNYETIKYDTSYSKIHNDSSSKGGKEEAFSCNYNVTYDTLFQPGGQFGFSVTKDGNVTNMFVTGLLGNTRDLKYEGSQPLTKCPDYLKLEDKITLTTNYIRITEGTSNSHNAVYNGKISTGEDNLDPTSSVITYVEYGNSPRSIVLEKVGGNYNYSLKEGKTKKSISINNLSDVSERLSSGDFPNYIMKVKGEDKYIFTDSKKDENGKQLEYDKIYVNSNYLSTIQGLGEEEIMETCYDLFGDTFLTFLQDNVFKIIYIGVPILLIILTSFDFAKVVFIDDKEGIQNAFKRLIRRAIVSVLIFLTPTIIVMFANLVGAGDNVQDCAKYIRSTSVNLDE